MYVPLVAKTNFSFLEGASHPEELVETAHAYGLPALAITDRDGVHGIVRAHVKAVELGLKIIIGSEVTLDDGSRLVLLAMSKTGYSQLCRLVSKGRLRCEKGSSEVRWPEVLADTSDLIALVGPELREHAMLAALRDAFGDRLYGTCPRHLHEEEREAEGAWRVAADALRIPLVAVSEVLYHTPRRRPLQDVLTCIRHGVTLANAGRLVRQNAEHDLKTGEQFATLFRDSPEFVKRTLEISNRCQFDLRQIRYRYPTERLPDGTARSIDALRLFTHAGARRRYPEGVPAKVLHQIDKELALIEELDYAGYFLTMYEIVKHCRSESILCQGRGSAANSAVCYCLGVTAVDPARHDLLFERFLSRERAEPPDIDLDITHERREEVIQWMYTRYGRDHAAMVANVIRYRGRSAIREVGKAMGLPESELDRIARQLSDWGALKDDDLVRTGITPDEPGWAFLIELAAEIQEFPRHLSIHPGGFLLGHEPVHDLVPIENGTMKDRTVIQWDKYDVEALGLFKVDLLGLGALTHLDKAFALIEKHRDERWSMATLPPDDPATYAMCGRADTVGVFQIESRAQMSMLPRLKPETFYDLVIEISIVRPGPITGGMVHPYLRRRAGIEAVEYPHECLKEVLHKTLGVPLFQEQVMKLAMVAADYTPGEADQLRRDMAAWKRSTSLERHRERLVTRMQQKGIAVEFAERVFNQIKGFGEYGFPESHAASFALIAYATAWLKCHYHAEFTCALLNSLPMGFYAPSTIIEDAKRHDIDMRPIDVRRSAWDCTLEPHGDALAVRMGVRYVKGLTAAEGERIVAAGASDELAEFVKCAKLSLAKLRMLIEAGAVDTYGLERRQALWTAEGVAQTLDPLPLDEQEEPLPLPALSPGEQITWDFRTSEHSTRGHPLTHLRARLTAQKLPDAKTLNALPNKRRVKYAGLVICRQHPATAAGVTFMTLEDETGLVNVVIWKQVFERHAIIMRTAGFLGITGYIQVQDGVVHLIADELWRPNTKLGMKTKSRDFR